MRVEWLNVYDTVHLNIYFCHSHKLVFLGLTKQGCFWVFNLGPATTSCGWWLLKSRTTADFYVMFYCVFPEWQHAVNPSRASCTANHDFLKYKQAKIMFYFRSLFLVLIQTCNSAAFAVSQGAPSGFHGIASYPR